MAVSSPNAQVLKLCELCEQDNRKWRCLDCDKCLCQRCHNVHLKVPITAQHEMVSIETPLQNIQRKIVTDSMVCNTHPKKMSCLFCKTCNILICAECVSSVHNQHGFLPIENLLQEKLEKLRDKQDTIINDIKICELKTKETENEIDRYNSIFDDSVRKIKQKEKELVADIQRYSKSLLDKIKNERRQLGKEIAPTKQQANHAKMKLEYQSRELALIIESNQGKDIFEATITIPDLIFDAFPNEIKHFCPGLNSEQYLQATFGSIQIMSIPTANQELQFEVFRHSVTDLQQIHQICTIDDTSAWISNFEKQVVNKVSIQHSDIKTAKNISFKATDMAITCNNDILLTAPSEIKLINSSGEIRPYLKVAPLVPHGIHVTRDNEVIVGVTEVCKKAGSLYLPTNKSHRAVIIFAENGNQKKSYQNDGNTERLFTVPNRIRTNNYHDILVIDRTSSNSGRVVALDRDGNLNWIYEGNTSINVDEQFDPSGIVITSAELNRIIISDYGSNAVHMLSRNGEVLLFKDLTKIGIVRPFSLDIDRGGQLWVGCHTVSDQSFAELRIISIF